MKSIQEQILRLCQIGIEYSSEHIEFLQSKISEWDTKHGDTSHIPTQCAEMQITIDQRYADLLKLIILLYFKQCKHPKKMRDKSINAVYCMDCNQNITDAKLVKKLMSQMDIESTIKRFIELSKTKVINY